ncbi:hypothetical protein FPOAC2_09500 [Fusarium poae]|jgi:hypothetical protein
MRNFRCLDRNTLQFASCAEAENALGNMSEFFHGIFPVKEAPKHSCRRLLASNVKLVFPQTNRHYSEKYGVPGVAGEISSEVAAGTCVADKSKDGVFSIYMIFHLLDDDVDHQMAQESWRKRTLIPIFVAITNYIRRKAQI